MSKKGVKVGNNYCTRTLWGNRLKNNFIKSTFCATSLISAEAYDAMLRFVHNKPYSGGRFDVNTEKQSCGNYSGSSEESKVCNIYDLSGDRGSATAENNDQEYMLNRPVYRGGSIPSYRYRVSDGSETMYARATLYILN